MNTFAKSEVWWKGVGEGMEEALVEVFDEPEYLAGDKPYKKPQQNRLRACVTSSDRICRTEFTSFAFVATKDGMSLTCTLLWTARQA